MKFHFPDTIRYYGSWLTPVASDEYGITVPWSDFEDRQKRWGSPIDAFTEYDLSMFRVCDTLIPKGKCVFHGATFQWKQKAFIFIGPSGVGKTTQLRHWMSLWGDEIEIMNGDKPILQLRDDGTIEVLPSPWRGKERWSNDNLSAPLGGVILLKQGSRNQISRNSSGEFPGALLLSVLASFEKKETIHGACQIADVILQSVPIWRLVNVGDRAAAKLTKETILKDGVFDAI